MNQCFSSYSTIHRRAGRALSSRMEKADNVVPAEIVPGQFTSQGNYQEGQGFLPLFWKTFPGPGEWGSLTPPGAPQSHLSILAFH